MWLLLWNTTIINVKLMQREQSQVNKNNIIIKLFFWKKLEKTQKGIFRPNLSHFRSWGGESLLTEALLPPQKELNQELLFCKSYFFTTFYNLPITPYTPIRARSSSSAMSAKTSALYNIGQMARMPTV